MPVQQGLEGEREGEGGRAELLLALPAAVGTTGWRLVGVV